MRLQDIQETHNSYTLNAFSILAIAVIILGISAGFNSWKSYSIHNSLRSQITDMQQIVIENTKTVNKLARIAGAW